MQNIIYGVANKPQKFTYQTKINDTTYYYTGEENEVYFLEEICFKIISKVLVQYSFNIDIKTDVIQFLVNSDEGFYFVTLNEGDDTVFYSINEFSEEEVYSFLSELIYKPENMFVISVADDEFTIYNEIIGLDMLIFDEKEILKECVYHIKGAVKFLKYIKKHFLTISLILLIIITPFVTLNFINNFIISKQTKQLTELKNQKLIKKTLKSKNIQSVVKFNGKYKKYLKQEDIIDSKKKNINDLVAKLRINAVADSMVAEKR